MEPLKLLPANLHERARSLLEGRSIRRPAETLAYLTQCLLSWRTALKGAPDFTTRTLRPLVRNFQELGFDAVPGNVPPWNKTQRTEAESIFTELAGLVAASPAMELPPLQWEAKATNHVRMLRCIWNHLDYHGAALTLGLMESGILALDPEDARYASQSTLRDRIVQLASTLVPFAAYLAGPSGAEMSLDQAQLTASALLDGLAASLESAFQLGGSRGLWLARSGGWERPGYPCAMGDFNSAIQGLPRILQNGLHP